MRTTSDHSSATCPSPPQIQHRHCGSPKRKGKKMRGTDTELLRGEGAPARMMIIGASTKNVHHKSNNNPAVIASVAICPARSISMHCARVCVCVMGAYVCFVPSFPHKNSQTTPPKKKRRGACNTTADELRGCGGKLYVGRERSRLHRRHLRSRALTPNYPYPSLWGKIGAQLRKT